MIKCNQICPWNYYERGCLKPHQEVCPLDNTANQKKLKTNADRIRAMTDEELAEFLMHFSNGVKRWIKQSAE